MAADPIFFRDLAYVILAALLGGGLAWLARQPLILGYVLGGVLISPLTPGPAIEHVHTFELFAEIGVVLLMFSIGIEFSLRDLLRVKGVALLGAPLGIALSVGLALALGRAVGWPPLQSLVIGIVVSVASTMVLARLLLDHGELHSQHGRVMVGITLVEDLAVVILTVLVPVFGTLEPGRLLAIGTAIGKALLILLPFGYLAMKLVPPLMTWVARTRNAELFLFVTLAVGLGTAALSQAVGLSLALGAFLAGLVISESDYAHETLARLLPLRDTFVALFFVTIGALIDPRSLFAHLPLLLAIVGLIVVGKLLIWTLVVLLFGYPIWTAALVGIGLTQIGEFSFILVQVARSAGHVGQDVYQATLAASLLTILVNAALVRYLPERIGRVRLARQQRQLPPPEASERLHDHVIVMGFGRIGSAVGEALDTFGVGYLVVERDPDIVRGLRARGVPCLFGDGSQPRLVEAAGADRARLAVVTIPDGARAELALSHLRSANPRLPILTRAHDSGVADRLEQKGATRVIRPEIEGAAALIRSALGHLALPQERVYAYLDRFREAMELPEAPIISESDRLPQVRDLTLGKTGAIADQSLREARVRERFGVTVLTLTRADGGELVLNPPAETILRPGDRVRVFGLPEQIRAFAESARVGERDSP